MIFFKKYFLYMILLITSCARHETINMKLQDFSEIPQGIIWLSVPGLEIEHLGMLKLHHGMSQRLSPFEQFICMGQTWTYNLYDLRPNSYQSFLSQILGTKNIKNTCDDYTHTPLWDYLKQTIDTEAIILENGIDDKYSVTQGLKCSQSFLANVVVLRMEIGNKTSNLFHHQERNDFKRGEIYFDKTCQRGNCFASVLNNTKLILNYLKENKKRPLVIIRDGRYERALETNNLAHAREILSEIESLTSYINTEMQTMKNSLVLLSSGPAKKLDFPRSGKDWKNFETKGKGITVKNTSLLSFVMAKGANAQNFCGIYDESELALRVLWSAPRKLFSW